MNKEEKEAINMINSQKENVDECLIAMEIPENYIGEDVEKEYQEWSKNAEIILNLIQKQEKIIDKMVEKINQAYFDKENMYIWFEEKILPKDEFGLCDYKDLGTRKTCIKEYFKKVVDEDVKD